MKGNSISSKNGAGSIITGSHFPTYGAAFFHAAVLRLSCEDKAVKMFFTALQKAILLTADREGRIGFPASAPEAEIYLETLLNLQDRGFVTRDKPKIPLLPFQLSVTGFLIQRFADEILKGHLL